MHRKLDILAEKGYVILRDRPGPMIPAIEWESLTYMDWKSGGDTNFAPLASAFGEMECRGFWDHGKADKDGIWTTNRELAPSLVKYVEEIGCNYGRVRVIKLNPSDEDTARRQLHRDDNNRLNPEGSGWVVRSWLELDDAAGESTFIHRDPDQAASRYTAADRHRASVPRRAPSGPASALRADHLLGDQRRAGALGQPRDAARASAHRDAVLAQPERFAWLSLGRTS
jgi:hypothetical protein